MFVERNKGTGVLLGPLLGRSDELGEVVVNFVANVGIDSHFTIRIVLEHIVDNIHHGGQVVHGLPLLRDRLVAELAIILVNQRVIDVCDEFYLSIS